MQPWSYLLPIVSGQSCGYSISDVLGLLHKKILITAVAMFGSACTALGAAPAQSQPEVLFDQPEVETYRFDLAKGASEPVCLHMHSVYNNAFRRPWYFRGFLRTQYPAVFELVYGTARGRQSPDALQVYVMRYALYPSSPEFDAVSWKTLVLDAGSHSQQLVRGARLDLLNNGKPVSLIQTTFYGLGGGEDNMDHFLIWRGELPGGERPAITTRELIRSSNYLGEFSGHVVRPFVFDGVTYLHVYSAAASDVDSAKPAGRHAYPEKVWIKTFSLAAQDGGATVPGRTICEFEMQFAR